VETFDKRAGFDEREDARFDGGDVTLSALLRWSRAMVIRRAIVLADGTFCRF